MNAIRCRQQKDRPEQERTLCTSDCTCPSGPSSPPIAPVATLFHDAGAVAQCGYCKRYTLDRRALSDRQPTCACGKSDGWSGSFVSPDAGAKWHGPAPVSNHLRLVRVEGDILPPLGEIVLIHLASLDKWVPHKVAGYYVWPGLKSYAGFRVNVRVVDSAGYPNARMLEDVRRLDGTPYATRPPTPSEQVIRFNGDRASASAIASWANGFPDPLDDDPNASYTTIDGVDAVDDLFLAVNCEDVPVRVGDYVTREAGKFVILRHAGEAIKWPKEKRVGRREDMSPNGTLIVGLDSDNDVYIEVSADRHGQWQSAAVEFCNGGGGGGQSSRTRAALINLMTAIEADNAEHPHKASPPIRETDKPEDHK